MFQNNISIKILKASLEAFFVVVEHKIHTSQVKLFIIFKYSVVYLIQVVYLSLSEVLISLFPKISAGFGTLGGSQVILG